MSAPEARESEHQATVDKGLRMKITKRTKNSSNIKSENSTKNENSAKGSDQKVMQNSDRESTQGASGSTSNGTITKQSSGGEKSPKVKGVHRKDKLKDLKGGKSVESSTTGIASVNASLDNAFSQVSLEPKLGETADPYEFNAKVEDGISIPVKGKGKTEKEVKSEASTDGVSNQCVGTDICSVGTETEPDCLGPCEPGTHVNLDGIVWQETENGVLVVNVTWRGKTYVGTLLDATKHDWAPPRPNCDSPVSDFETRTPKGRGTKRGRGNSTGTPVNEKLLEGRKLRKGRRGSTFTAPTSPAKSDISTPSSSLKRKGRPTDIDLSSEKSVKRSRSCSRGNSGEAESPLSGLLECPDPSCNKKYRNPNGLRYHQSHAHSNTGIGVDVDEESRDMLDTNEDSNLDDLDSNMGDTNCDVNSSAINNDMSQFELEEESNSSTKRSDEDTVPRDGAAIKSDGDIEDRDNESANIVNSANLIKPIKKDIISVAPQIQPSPTVAIATATPFHVVSTQQASPSFGSAISQSKSITTGLVTPISATIVTAATIQASIPIPVAEQTKPMEKLIRPKTANRPIMPSNMITLTTNVAHTNFTPVTTHVPSTTQLKPIQPKPTVMGENPPVNQVLLGLNKERKPKPKKKLKESLLSSPVSSTLSLSSSPSITFSSSSTTMSTSSSPFSTSHKKPSGKHEPPGVIKVAPIVAKPQESNKTDSNQYKTDTEPVRPLGHNVGVIQAQVHPMKGIDLSSRSSESSPSVLKVTPSLHVPASDNNRNISDDVQSPAYSDISDANDGGSPAPPPTTESPPIRVDDSSQINKPKDLSCLPESAQSYGMYGQYYPQSSYLLQNLSPSAHSPSSSQKSSVMNKEISESSRLNSEGQIKIKEESKEEKREGSSSSSKMEAVRPFSQTEYQQIQHQKWVQQQMFYLQTLPYHQQNQYMHQYAPYMDYHMHMMQNDPRYRQHFEKLMEDPHRMHEGMSSGRNEIDLAYKSKSSSDSSQRSSSAGPSSMEGSRPFDKRDESREEGNLREKQNENHQFMKENVDLKSQMDKNRLESTSGNDRDRSHSQHRMTEEQQRRQIMYQQQKYIEQQKREEQRRSEVNKTDVKREDLSKREGESSSKSKSSIPDSSKSTMHSEDKSRGQSVLEKPRITETPKSKVGIMGKASSPLTPSSSMPTSVAHSPSMTSGAPYYPYSQYPSQYMQSPPYGHVQFDPSHPMYQRGINHTMMYSAGPYLHHPSQLGYRVGEESIDKDSSKPKVPIEAEGKVSADSSHNSLYHSGNGHKIHELQEKGRPSPHRSSPVLGKSEGNVPTVPVSGSIDKGREFSNSPPTQRHVHTHHHTHVLEAAYPVYPYTGILSGTASQPSTPSSSLPHPPYPPSK